MQFYVMFSEISMVALYRKYIKYIIAVIDPE